LIKESKMKELSLKGALYLMECVDHAKKHGVREPDEEEDGSITYLMYTALLKTPNLDINLLKEKLDNLKRREK
tara:strand:- start:146 stop:364 length:219 start_codon:yes stop_codon:yes gene_type:complete